eukprot:1160146-Pelagomonas_calceolata.AAC.4
MELKEFSARKQESSSLSAYRERQGNRAMETASHLGNLLQEFKCGMQCLGCWQGEQRVAPCQPAELLGLLSSLASGAILTGFSPLCKLYTAEVLPSFLPLFMNCQPESSAL